MTGILIGAVTVYLVLSSKQNSEHTVQHDQNAPLYWVAPMDSNYRRDKPGKSPMGMDLVPVYSEENTTNRFGDGVVTIKPNVINNLGVRTTKVRKTPFVKTISTVGNVKYDEDKIIHIHPRVEGWIDKLYVKATGNPVKKEQPLYTLYSPQLVNAQEEFLIAINRNNTSLITAAKERLKALQLTDEFIKTLAVNKEVKQSITFYSSQSGFVKELKIREGFYVKPGTTMMSIAKLDSVWVEADVFERDSANIKQGLPITMTLDYLPGRLWTGKINYVYPTLNEKNRTLTVRLMFDNADLALKPNMFTKVSIDIISSEPTLLVPKEAVIRTGKQNRVVLALGDGMFKSIKVLLGQSNNDNIEVLSGLAEDELVVTSAQFLIDSESSKTSDFKRMDWIGTSQSEMDEEEAQVPVATVSGLINHINIQNRTINITREAIEKWNRGKATMDFVLSQHHDIEQFEVGMQVEFTFEVRDDLVITSITPVKPHSEPRLKKSESTDAKKGVKQ